MNNWISISALLGGTSVILGAFAAHGLQGRVDEKALEWVRTGAHYQMVHALALLGWALFAAYKKDALPLGSLPGWGFALGSVIFSGTLYAMAFGAPRWFGAITPVGGLLLICAWFALAWQAGSKQA
jgi:uncharacterized membrane protein YgdD (TMEM256/DUF423 family)